MLLVDRVFHVVELALVLLEELVGLGVRRKHDRLVQLALKWSVDALDNAVGGAFLGLFHLLELNFRTGIGFQALHINFTRLVPVSHTLLIGVLVACFREVSDKAVSCVRIRCLSDGAALVSRLLNLLHLLLLHQYFLGLDVDHLNVHWSVNARRKIVIVRGTHAVLLNLNLILTFCQVATNVLEGIFTI
jgi:hypothetical protein